MAKYAKLGCGKFSKLGCGKLGWVKKENNSIRLNIRYLRLARHMSKQAKLISDYIELPTLELTVPVQTQGTTVLLGTRVGRQTNVCQVGNSILGCGKLVVAKWSKLVCGNLELELY